jgi:hypothetical protein
MSQLWQIRMLDYRCHGKKLSRVGTECAIRCVGLLALPTYSAAFLAPLEIYGRAHNLPVESNSIS